MNKFCKTCNQQLSVGVNWRESSRKNSMYFCNTCINSRTGKYVKQYIKEGRQSYKDSYKKNNTKRKSKIQKAAIERLNKHRLDYWIVYLLPKEHYVGKTNNPTYRMPSHRYQNNRDTTGWTILHEVKTESEALELEAHYHHLGYKGYNYGR